MRKERERTRRREREREREREKFLHSERKGRTKRKSKRDVRA